MLLDHPVALLRTLSPLPIQRLRRHLPRPRSSLHSPWTLPFHSLLLLQAKPRQVQWLVVEATPSPSPSRPIHALDRRLVLLLVPLSPRHRRLRRRSTEPSGSSTAGLGTRLKKACLGFVFLLMLDSDVSSSFILIFPWIASLFLSPRSCLF